jgi:16S rRNA (cytosine1402-N4)-methyltransferase
MTSGYHQPVMLAECIEALQIKPDGLYADVTFGGGGHIREILKHLKNGKLIGFDQDSDALNNVPSDDRFEFVHHNYRFIKNFLKFQNNCPIDGILADLGISSHQIDEESRGFSYRYDAPLDMRMSVGAKLTAEQVLNTYDERALDHVFRHYGELPKSWQMSKAIVRHRVASPIATTWQLKEVLNAFVPAKKDLRFWSQVFQALRIEVNAELEALKIFLRKSAEVLKPGGRLVVLTYHSLEDRLVKHFIQKGSFEGEEELEKDLYGARQLPFTAVNKKPQEPTSAEIEANPRARSAKLRIAEKN